MRKKTLLALLLACAMMMSLAACGNAAQTAPETTAEKTTAAVPETTKAAETTASAETTPAETEKVYDTKEAALPENYLREEKNEAANAKYAPRVITLESGVQIQKTPYDNTVKDGKYVSSWNNLYMDADNRGCNSCHTLEDALANMDTYHGVIYFKYDNE